MKKRPREIILKTIGIAFILLGLLACFNTFYFNIPFTIFWLCYVSLILLGVGIFIKSDLLVQSQFYLLTIPNTIWSIDFLYNLFSSDTLFGITDYIFIAGPMLPKLVSLQHLITLPIMIYVIILMKPKHIGAIYLSIFEVSLTYLFARLFTPEVFNVNCVYRPCMPIETPSFYPFWWFLVVILMIIGTHEVLKLIVEKKK